MTRVDRFVRLLALRAQERNAASMRLADVRRLEEASDDRLEALRRRAEAAREEALKVQEGPANAAAFRHRREAADWGFHQEAEERRERERLRSLGDERVRDLLSARIGEEKMRVLLDAARLRQRWEDERAEGLALDEMGQRMRREGGDGW